MKKSTIILIITGVLCSIVSIVCICAAAVRLADLGVSFAETNINGRNFVWDSSEDWEDWEDWSTDETWENEWSYDDTSSENVDVNLPFVKVHVYEENVQVSLPGILVDVNEDTEKVNVKIGVDDTDTTPASAAAPAETSQKAAETTKN